MGHSTRTPTMTWISLWCESSSTMTLSSLVTAALTCLQAGRAHRVHGGKSMLTTQWWTGGAMTLPTLCNAGLLFRLVDRLVAKAWGCMESASWDHGGA